MIRYTNSIRHRKELQEGKLLTFCEKKIKTPKDLVDVLKSGDYRLIKGGEVT